MRLARFVRNQRWRQEMRRPGLGNRWSATVFSRVACTTGAALVIAAVSLMLFAARPVTPESDPGDRQSAQLAALVPYSVRLDGEHAEFDLNFAPNTRFLLVIGSLGLAESQFSVDCSSTAIPKARFVPVDRVSTRFDAPPRQTCERPAAPKAIAFDAANAGKQDRSPIKTQRRTFSLHVTDGTLDDPAQYVTIHANAIAEGRDVRVYLDDQQPATSLAPGLVRNVIDLFDGDIVPSFRGLLGTYRDVDHDGRFAILLSPWLGRLQGGRTSVGGFVRGSDFQSCLDKPFSNRCDMMYLNSQTLPGSHLRTLLIHEYTHAVCFSRRAADRAGLAWFPDEEDWLNEAIAHCAESLFGGGWSNLDYRIARFLDDPSVYPLVVSDYYRAGLWRCHGCRGATYLFLRYCVEQFGPQLLARLIADPARGTRNLELATGHSFEDIFRAWTLSLAEAGWHQPAAAKTCASDPAAEPALAPLDPYGSLGDWGLAGPKTQLWNVAGERKEIQLRGTSAAYLELVGGKSVRPRRICLNGTSGSALLVSVVRLEDRRRPIEIDAEMRSGPRGAKAMARTEDKCVHVILRLAGDVTVDQISVEQNCGETHASVCFAGAALKQIERLSSQPPANTGPAISSEYDVPVARFSDGGVPIVVRAVATDRNGRRTSARAVLEPHALPQRLAQHAL